jgi:hypothetical protein
MIEQVQVLRVPVPIHVDSRATGPVAMFEMGQMVAMHGPGAPASQKSVIAANQRLFDAARDETGIGAGIGIR